MQLNKIKDQNGDPAWPDSVPESLYIGDDHEVMGFVEGLRHAGNRRLTVDVEALTKAIKDCRYFGFNDQQIAKAIDENVQEFIRLEEEEK